MGGFARGFGTSDRSVLARPLPRKLCIPGAGLCPGPSGKCQLKHAALIVSKHAALIVFGLVLGLGCLEIALRTSGWIFLQMPKTAERPLLKQATEYRILCLGESTTADLRFLGQESYPAQLQRILNERSHGVGFTVINRGVPATTTDTIVEQLPENLERYHPDIVVTMMGINDGESIDPVFQISGRLRVWKLAKMLYYTYRNPQAAVFSVGPTPPDLTMMSGQIAWQRVIEERYPEAEAILRPLLEQELWSIVKSRSHGLMAILSWKRGDEQEGERYHQKFLELERHISRAKTARNYQELRRILADHEIPLVAVQYPGLPLDMLRQITGPDPGVVFVDNEQTFLQAIKAHPVRDIYRDLFGGIFGHLTPYGNGLLAENVARRILELTADDRFKHGTPVNDDSLHKHPG